MAAWEKAPVVEDKAASGSGDGGISLEVFNDADPSFSSSLGFHQASLQQPTGARKPAWQSAPVESERPMPKRSDAKPISKLERIETGMLDPAVGLGQLARHFVMD